MFKIWAFLYLITKLDLQNLMIDYDKQTELLDQEKDKLEASEKLVGDLTKRLHVAVEQVNSYLGLDF